MGLRCKRCGSEAHVKNGLMRGQQRYRCKACGLNFTDTPPRGKPLALKVAAVLLYVSGLSMNRTAKLLGVSTPTIQAWLEQFAATYAQKPEPEGRAVVIELDEMWHYLKKSPNPSGSGRLGIVLQGDWWIGNAAVVTRSPVSASLSVCPAGARGCTVRTTTPSMACCCRSGNSIRARRRHMASNGTTPASGIGWRASEGAPSWSQRPSGWLTSASPCSPASPETTRSTTSYLC